MPGRGELYHLIRYFNLLVGLLYIYYYTEDGSIFLLSIGALNIGVWVFTRSSWKNEYR